MIRRIRRWWYRWLGLDIEAHEMLCYALYGMACGDEKAYPIWQEAYGEIHEICTK